MWLYKISQSENNDYDTYDSAVVIAKSEQQARRIHPQHGLLEGEEYRECIWSSPYGSWASCPDNVTVQYLGVADPSLTVGVIVASFNAG